MVDKPNIQIIIRHTAGTKINQVDPFALADTAEISFGREAGSSVRFDGPKDDVVSRRHAVLRVKKEGSPKFEIEDLGSRNGTIVNGERITRPTELLPDDTVELGKGGPKFAFDVQPRPENMAARTRVISAFESTATRAIETATATRAVATTATTAAGEPAKTSVGKNTVMMMLTDERKKTGRKWMGVLAAALALVIGGGGVLYSRVQREATAQAAAYAERASTTAAQQLSSVTGRMGMSPGEVVNKFGNSSVWITVNWRLFDKETGRPVFHKAYKEKDVKAPAYLKVGDKVYAWLTTEDDEHFNYDISAGGAGSGFVVNEQGFILTNRHVATGWLRRLSVDTYLGKQNYAWVFTLREKKSGNTFDIQKVAFDSLPNDVKRWNPGEDRVPLFQSKRVALLAGSLSAQSMATPSDTASFFGKNEKLEVRFPGNSLGINATNVRQSTLADVALIKIDSPQALQPIDLSSEETIKVGERVVVLGYPSVSTSTLMATTSSERGELKNRIEVVPEPTVTEGIISKLGTELTKSNSATVMGTLGDAFQLSINSTGAGNSGGPVFNSAGKVVGLFTYGGCDGGACVSYAVPIKHGQFLLNPQRSQN